MKKTVALIVFVLAVLMMAVPAFAVGQDPDAQNARAKRTSQLYIVQMADAPVVAYDGGIPGLAATRPKQGQKINPNSSKVVKYVDFLSNKHERAVQAVGGKKVYSYTYTYNGFAAQLTAQQAEQIAKQPGVLAVTRDEVLQLDTSSTPDFLGLTQSGSLWYQLGYPGDANKKVDGAGEDIIIGIVDGGIWPEHPSVSDRDARGRLVYQQIPGWHGRCVPGEEFTAANCNQKLIGARYYNAGWGGNAGIDAQLPWEYNSPRDFGGHGTHTATTAGGNYGVPATGAAAVFGNTSGIAPRARIAAYKVCWETGAGGSCFTTDSVAAIDQAVADGVDVINFSISGSRTNFRDPVEIAFLFAADAGVFVAASAGNNGPTSSTVAHPGPWLTTVAAGTHNRTGEGSVTLGNGMTYAGASFATAVPESPLVDSVDVVLAGATTGDAELCFPGSLDPAQVTGKIVLCKRGAIALVSKSLAVYEAGGAGMVLYNDPLGATNTLALLHSVPTVHVVAASGLAVKSYIASEGANATASIAQASILYDVPAPFTASFSSRGPLLAGGGDLLKPDVIAPGQEVLAGVAPPGNAGRLFDLYSGTSMSSPHVAGLGALMKDLYPTWTPAMIKSALMTTGYDVLDGGTPAPNTNPVLIFRQGAGHVQPNKAADPGLVFNAGWNDWLGFLCGTQLPTSFCTSSGIPVLDPSDYNSPSIAIGDLAGTQTIRRTVTNVGATAETYDLVVSGLSGFTVSANPTSFTIPKGGTQTIDITITRTTATLNTYRGGQFTWTGNKGHVVRVPAVVRPVALAVPAEVFGAGTSGSTSFDIKFGYDGAYTAGKHGLNPATTFVGTVPDDPTDTFVPGGPGTVSFDFDVPAATAYTRFALFDDYTDGNDDLDLYVYRSGSLVGSSGGGTSAEQVNFALPTAGTYTVWVHGWQTDGPDANFTLFAWNVGLVDDAGNMTVTAPAVASIGPATIGVDWTGLTANTKYLGAVSHTGPSGLLGLTVVNIETD